ncbi:fimbrial protein [Serratia marcescens]|uniref:fimbrial protein n=1 Tax=Serratia marcescens TaxID=615 RepID=UPI00301C930C
MLGKTLLATVLVVAALPADAGTGTEMNFKGFLFEPTCKFNGGKTIDIDFDRVGIKRVDGVKYARTTTVSLSCRPSEGKKLMLQIQGNVVSGTSNVLDTNVPNLGIAFRDSQGTSLALNRFFNVQSDTAFSLISVPVKKDVGLPLEVGEFSAVATLVSSYF